MRKSLWIIALLFVAIGAPRAHADSVNYTITFTGGSPNTPSGSFAYDTTTNQFTSFRVVWGSYTFDLWALDVANSPLSSNFTASTCAPKPDAQAFFNLLTGCDPTTSLTWQAHDIAGLYFDIRLKSMTTGSQLDILGFNLQGGTSTQGSASGTLAATAAPEPGTGFLTLIGIGSGWVMRKRIALGL